MLLKVLFYASAVLCSTTQAYFNDYGRYNVAAGGRKGGYEAKSYPVSPFPIVTHPHSAQNAAMQVQVQYKPSGVGAPWGTSAPAQLTKAPPIASYGPIPAASYPPISAASYPSFPARSRYQPGAREAGFIPEPEFLPQHKGDYGFHRYGSDQRYEPGYGPLPQLNKGYSLPQPPYDRSRYDKDYVHGINTISRESGHDSRKYGQKPKEYGQKPGGYGHKSREYEREPKEYGHDSKYGRESREFGRDSIVHGSDSREYGHSRGHDSIRDPQFKGYRHDSRDYSPKGYETHPRKGDIVNGHSYYPPKNKGTPWERPHSSQHYTSRPYGPEKPTHGPWNHPGFHGPFYPARSDPVPTPTRPWSKSAPPTVPDTRAPQAQRHEPDPPRPISSFHVVDSVESRPQLNTERVKIQPKDGEKQRRKQPKRQPQKQPKMKKTVTKDSKVDAKALEDDGSGDDEEQVYKNGKEDDHGLPPDCKGMTISDPKKRISPGRMALMCRLYKGWGKDMTEGKKWKPTQKQDDWFSSLGSHRGLKRSKRQALTKALRKEYRALTDSERDAFHTAMNTLKTDTMDGISKYDLFVNFHRATNAPGAHFGAAFLPWHREMLLRFENALREINDSLSLPYWDSNLDHSLGDLGAQSSVIWTDSFFGNGKGDVTTGPFKFWRLAFPSNLSRSGIIYRNLTLPPPDSIAEPRLMSDNAVLSILEADYLRNITWFVDSTFETHHGSVYNWVGGVLADLPVSPSDPVFFLHHAFIDCLWEQMRIQQRSLGIDPRFDYPNDTVALGVGELQPGGTILQFAEASAHYALAIMQPFRPLRNIDGLADEYFDEFYDCAPSPYCTTPEEDCGSPYLFCEKASLRCLPRLTLGALCAGFAVSEPCFDSVCCRGRCRRTCDEE